MYEETGHTFQPVAEDADDAYLFEERMLQTGTLKGSYQHNAGLANRLAGEQLKERKVIKDDADVEKWNGGGQTCYSCRKKKKTTACASCKLAVCKHYPAPEKGACNHLYPADAKESEKQAARECDFYKFRGHGLNQITGRANFTKHVEPFLKKYLQKSLDDKEMGPAALTAAFVDTRIYLNVFNSFYRGLSAAMDAVDESPPNWHDVGQLTNGSEEYADILIARCDKLLSAMKDEKWSCG
jgi:hypothetical protein